MPPILIGSEIYRRSTYGPKHPLAIPRVSTALDLIEALGWLPPGGWLAAPRATPVELARFHSEEYISALVQAEATQRVDPIHRQRFHIGAHGNPVYREVFSRPATSAGGVMLAARHLLEGGIAYCPGGGTHHGQPARASGFCYLNDPVLGILTWLDAGLTRVLYLDIDAHHGDGVEAAFAGDPRVLTVSVHEAERWPFTGRSEDRAGGSARNLPVPAGFNDSEMLWLLHQAILPLLRRFRPQAIFLQAGADALAEDPLSRLTLSNQAHWAVVRALIGAAPRLLITGGGGYNPWSVARCWTGIWGILAGQEIPLRLPSAAEAVLRGLTYHRAAGRDPPEHWFTTLADVPRPGVVRAAVQRVAAAAMVD
jgi:acetoin utilization protein AcuC